MDADKIAALSDDPTTVDLLTDKAAVDAWNFIEANPDVPCAGNLRQALYARFQAVKPILTSEAEEVTPEPQSTESDG